VFGVRVLVSLFIMLVLIMPLTLSPLVYSEKVYFRVTSLLAVPNGLVGFELDYEGSRADGILSGLKLDFYLSRNSIAAITSEDVYLSSVRVTLDTMVVFGTLKLPGNDTLYALLSSTSGVLYVKVSDGSRVLVSSVRVDLSSSKLNQALQLSNRRIAAFEARDLGVSDSTRLTINIELYNLDLTLADLEYNITRLRWGEYSMRLIEYNESRRLYESDIYRAFSVRSSRVVFESTFTVMREFPLKPNMNTTIYGVRVDFAGFMLEYYGGILKDYINAIKVDAGRQVNYIPRSFYDVEVKISLAWPNDRLVEIYPIARIDSIDRRIAGRTGELNVGDLISVTLRNYPPNSTITLNFYTVKGEFIGSTSIDKKTNELGSAWFNLVVPPLQYGGRSVILVFTVLGYNGVPAVNTTTRSIHVEPIKPHVLIWSYDNRGEPSTTRNIAPGSYILVIGRGFLAEPLSFELLDLDRLTVLAELTLLDMIGVLPNGSFVAIVKVPVDPLRLPPELHNTRVIVRAKGTEANVGLTSDVTVVAAKFLVLDYDGGAAVVYINPVAEARSVVDYRVNIIRLGIGRAYPYDATWEPEYSRVTVVEVIGLPRYWPRGIVNLTLLAIDIVTPGLPVRAGAPLALNQPITLGYLKNTCAIPVLPHTPSGYKVLVTTILSIFSISSEPSKEYSIRINATAAAIDPIDGIPKKSIAVISPVNLTIVGYGWAANLNTVFDMPPLVDVVDRPLNITDSRGFLRGSINLKKIIPEQCFCIPALYNIVVRQTENRVAPVLELRSTIILSVLRIPDFRVKLLAQPQAYGDLNVEVWIRPYFASTPARVDQVLSIKLEAYVAGIGVKVLKLRLFNLTLPEATYHASFTPIEVFGPGVLGKSILLKVSAIGRLNSLTPEQLAYDELSIIVYPIIFRDYISNITLASRASHETLLAVRELSDSLRRVLESLEALSIDVNRGIIILSTKSDLILSNARSIASLLEGIDSNILLVLGRINEAQRLLEDIRANQTLVVGGLEALTVDVRYLVDLVKSINASLVNIVIDRSMYITAELRDSRDGIIGFIRLHASALEELIKTSNMALVDLIEKSRSEQLAALRLISDSISTLRLDAVSRLQAISVVVDYIRFNVDATAQAVRELRLLGERIEATIKSVHDKVERVDSEITRVSGIIVDMREAMKKLATINDTKRIEGELTNGLNNIFVRQDTLEGIVRESLSVTLMTRIIVLTNTILLLATIALIAYLIIRVIRRV